MAMFASVVDGATLTRVCVMRVAVVFLSSMIAMFLPRQARGPLEKGMNSSFANSASAAPLPLDLALLVVLSVSHRSGFQV